MKKNWYRILDMMFIFFTGINIVHLCYYNKMSEVIAIISFSIYFIKYIYFLGKEKTYLISTIVTTISGFIYILLLILEPILGIDNNKNIIFSFEIIYFIFVLLNFIYLVYLRFNDKNKYNI